MAGLKEIENNTKTYEYKFGFLIDVVDRGDMWDVWLYNRDIYAKEFLFGLYKNSFENYQEFLECIESNLINQNYLTDYIEEYNTY